jgi:hypothetical protein
MNRSTEVSSKQVTVILLFLGPEERVMNEQKLKEYLLYANALLDSMRASVSRDPAGVWKFISYRTYIKKYNALLLKVTQEVPADAILDIYDLKQIPDEFNSPGALQQHLFESVFTNLSVLKSFLENKLNMRRDEIIKFARLSQEQSSQSHIPGAQA